MSDRQAGASRPSGRGAARHRYHYHYHYHYHYQYQGGGCGRRGRRLRRRSFPSPLAHLPACPLPLDRAFRPDTIRGFRERFGLTQLELAELLGMSKNSVGTYEREGAPQWMRYALIGIAQIRYGVAPAELGWLGKPDASTRRSARSRA